MVLHIDIDIDIILSSIRVLLHAPVVSATQDGSDAHNPPERFVVAVVLFVKRKFVAKLTWTQWMTSLSTGRTGWRRRSLSLWSSVINRPKRSAPRSEEAL